MSTPSQTHVAECPTITVECPTDLSELGETITVTATLTGAGSSSNPTYNWNVSAGTIVGGQGTPTVTVKLDCQTMTATLEVGGLDPSCQNRASCSLIIERPPVARKFDQYGDIAFKDEKARLDRFAAQLKNEAGSSGYIVFYDGSSANAGKAERRASRSKIYLINTVGIDNDRILTVDGGGGRKELALELWIAPQGAVPPPDNTKALPKCP
jgi:hypothetical protein